MCWKVEKLEEERGLYWSKYVVYKPEILRVSLKEMQNLPTQLHSPSYWPLAVSVGLSQALYIHKSLLCHHTQGTFPITSVRLALGRLWKWHSISTSVSWFPLDTLPISCLVKYTAFQDWAIFCMNECRWEVLRLRQPSRLQSSLKSKGWARQVVYSCNLSIQEAESQD